MANIETGVDKLVNLVAKEKKIDIAEAAKRLGVADAVVHEWAEFLEEEGLVSLQFSLSKTFIVEKRLSKTEVVKKEKEYDNKREAFVRRVDSALKQLDDDTAGFEQIKKQYDSVKHQIGDEIDEVKEEMEQLRHYEDLKSSIDNDILKQKVEYQKKLDDIRTMIGSEERRYKKLIDEIGEQTQHIKEEQAEFTDLKREESDLQKRIEALQDIIKRVEGRVDAHAQSINAHEQRFTTLRELAEKLRSDIIEKRKKEIEPMLQISDDQSKRIIRIQEEIVGKIKSGRDKMKAFEDQSKEISSQFERFFERRTQVERTLQELERAKHEMKEEMGDLIRKAKAFEITSKGADVNSHIKEMEEKFTQFEKRKGAFSSQLERLKSLILGKGDAKKGQMKLPQAPKSVEKAANMPAKPARKRAAPKRKRK
jgi:chromosome segregation ATPase